MPTIAVGYGSRKLIKSDFYFIAKVSDIEYLYADWTDFTMFV